MFSRLGEILVVEQTDLEAQMLAIMDLPEVVDVKQIDNLVKVNVSVKQLAQTKKNLEKLGFKVKQTEIIWRPKTLVQINNKQAKKIKQLSAELGEHDDVQNIFHNADLKLKND